MPVINVNMYAPCPPLKALPTLSYNLFNTYLASAAETQLACGC